MCDMVEQDIRQVINTKTSEKKTVSEGAEGNSSPVFVRAPPKAGNKLF